MIVVDRSYRQPLVTVGLLVAQYGALPTGINGIAWAGKFLIYLLYRLIGTVLFLVSYPVVMLLIWLHPPGGSGLRQRIGYGANFPAKSGELTRIWIHAASVGEVGAAAVLIRELERSGKPLDFIVSTMTVQGWKVAQKQMPEHVFCFLAPLDVAKVVRRVIDRAAPDVYACLETELWPVMLGELNRAGIHTVLLNGRLTERSLKRYLLVPGMVRNILESFTGIAVIREEDRERFARLGAARKSIQVTGNIKYDFPGEDRAAERLAYRKRLQVENETVFICGSTRSGEEKILAAAYQILAREREAELVWVVAPRHLGRMPEVEALLAGLGLQFDLYTDLNNRERTHSIVLVNCLGELSRLYSAADYSFVGGSLVECGGHNLMEPARWGCPVFYGPHVADFSDAADILEKAGAGFMVRGGEELAGALTALMRDRTGYARACENARKALNMQHGAAGRQAGMILRLVDNT